MQDSKPPTEGFEQCVGDSKPPADGGIEGFPQTSNKADVHVYNDKLITWESSQLYNKSDVRTMFSPLD